MRRRDETEDDVLKQFIDSNDRERPSDDFTFRVMEKLPLEPLTQKKRIRMGSRMAVPLFAALITLTLIVLAVVIPESTDYELALVKKLSALRLDFHPDLGFLGRLSIPGWMPYIFIDMLILLLLDKALPGLFHRSKKNQVV